MKCTRTSGHGYHARVSRAGAGRPQTRRYPPEHRPSPSPSVPPASASPLVVWTAPRWNLSIRRYAGGYNVPPRSLLNRTPRSPLSGPRIARSHRPERVRDGTMYRPGVFSIEFRLPRSRPCSPLAAWAALRHDRMTLVLFASRLTGIPSYFPIHPPT